MLNKEKLLTDMTNRFNQLNDMIKRDFNGSPDLLWERWMELKYWKEAIECGAYDSK